MGSGGKEKEPKQKKKPGRVPTSCAECRRLKLRCDRNVPCQKCESRGCGSICPDGVLTPGKGGRLVLANTEELHERIELISSRNRELEKALRTLQESMSDQPHPLLGTDNVLRLNILQGSSSGPSTSSSSKSPSTSRISPTTHPPDPLDMKMEDEDPQMVDAFGTMVIGRRGEMSFLGRTARPEHLIQCSAKPHRTQRPYLPRLPKRIIQLSFPESEIYDESLLSEILNLLPPQPEALHLCDLYLEYGKFFYSPISEKELLEETLAVIYRAKNYGGFDHYQTLSLLFIIFAIATLFNPSSQPGSHDANEYYYLSRASLNFIPVLHQTTLTAIQSLIHMGEFLELSELDSATLEAAWLHIGDATRLAFKAGLHLNESYWGLTGEASQRRSELTWRLFIADTWTSMHLGRPSGISQSQYACIPPPPPSENGASESFFLWNTRFSVLVHTIMESVLGYKAQLYSSIIKFDRNIRDFEVPVQWRSFSEDESSPIDSEVAIYRWLVLSAKETALLNLHRCYFAHALQESPNDLQRHRNLPSVVAIFRSSWRLIRGLKMTWTRIPDYIARVHRAWSYGLSAAIVMCLFATRAPASHLSSSALEELDILTSVFESSSSTCRASSGLLSSLKRLQRKSHEVIEPPHTRFQHQHHYDETIPIISTSELDRLNGKTFLLSENSSSSASSSMPSSSALASATVTAPSSSSTGARSRATSVTISDIAEPHVSAGSSSAHTPPFFYNIENLHSVLAQDLREFGIRSSMHSTTNLMSLFDAPGDDPMQQVPLPTSPQPPPPLIHPIPEPAHHQRPHSNPQHHQQPPESRRILQQQPFHRQAQSNVYYSPSPPPALHHSHSHDHFRIPSPSRSLFGYGSTSGIQTHGAFSSQVGLSSGGGFGGFGSSSFSSGVVGGGWNTMVPKPPFVLDPSWNNFVEQLGF